MKDPWINLPRSNNGAVAWYQGGSDNGTPIVFLHGVGLRAESWSAQLDYFGKEQQLFIWDMPGHGDSARLQADLIEVDSFVERLSQFMQDVVRQPAVLVGHSMGALLAVNYAARYPERCKAVAALNGVYQRDAEARAAVADRARRLRVESLNSQLPSPLQRWFGSNPSGKLKEMAEHCRRWLEQADLPGYADAYQVFAAEDGPTASMLQSLSMPALFLTGDGDKNSTPSMSTEMATLSPIGSANIISGAGHMAQMTHADEVNVALAALIKQAGATQ